MNKIIKRIALALVLLALLALLWETSPSRLFPECRGTDVPRHCVD